MATFLLNDSQIKSLIKKYHSYQRPTSNQYINASLKIEKTIINIYYSKKVVVQNSSDKLETEISLLHFENAKSNTFIKSHIGSDEVGTGDFFGPIVVVSSYVAEEQISQLIKLGVGDSKDFTDIKIMELAKILRKTIPYKTLVLPNIKYNTIIKSENMNSIKAKLHNRVLLLMLRQVKCSNVVVDQFTTPKSYFGYFSDKDRVLKNIIFETKAESKYLAVAVASIIARDTFLEEIKKLEQEHKVFLPLGAGPRVRNQIAKINQDKLVYLAKLNFKIKRAS